VSGHGFSESDTSSDITYGLGVDYWFNGQVSADLEYANFYDKDGVEVSGWTLGLNYKL
jgi:opacity protein-like surface antigen